MKFIVPKKMIDSKKNIIIFDENSNSIHFFVEEILFEDETTLVVSAKDKIDGRYRKLMIDKINHKAYGDDGFKLKANQTNDNKIN